MDLNVKSEEVISLANALLDHAVVPRHVTTIKQCNSTLFSQLYESLTGSKVPGIISQAPTSEAVKCQAVVNALNRHLAPHVNLDHIRGIDIAALDLLAFKNLLDIFAVLFHLPRTFCGSEYNDELEGSESVQNEDVMNDSNLISTEGLSVISEVLHEEMRRERKQESTDTDSTTELLRPVPSARLPPRVAQMTGLQEGSNNQGLEAERHSSSHTTNSSVQPPSLSISNIHTTTTATDISSSSSQEARRVISQVGEPVDNMIGAEPVSSNTVTVTPSLAQPPHTPPRSQQHPLLKSPLHHSTPHTSTRSRVFRDENVSTLTPAQSPTLRTMFGPSQGGTGVGTVDTHPVSQYPVHSTAPASDTGVGRDEVHLTENSASLHTEEESTVLPESSHSEVPNLTITDLTTTIQDTTNTGHPDTPQHSQSNHATSTQRRSASCNSSRTENSDDIESPDLSIDRSRLSRLDARAAQTRASVLAAIYKNYLSELKASQPHKATGKAKHSKTHGRKMHSYKSRHSRATVVSSDTTRDESESEQTKTPTKLSVGDNLMPLIERDFPFIHVSPSTMHRLMERQIKQVKALTSTTTQHSSTTVKKINEMELRYRTLLQVIKKELEHTKRMQRQYEQQQEKKKVKSSVSAKRQAAARSRRYFNEYELRLRAKMQRRRTREEQVFKKAFEEGLELQRERVRELRRYTREKQEEYAKHHKDQLESMENYYRDQFAMLVESTARERGEAVVRERAQHQAVCRMKHELRKKIEDEIKQLQESIDREEDVIHFRELDSENLRHKLSRLTFTAAVK